MQWYQLLCDVLQVEGEKNGTAVPALAPAAAASSAPASDAGSAASACTEPDSAGVVCCARIAIFSICMYQTLFTRNLHLRNLLSEGLSLVLLCSSQHSRGGQAASTASCAAGFGRQEAAYLEEAGGQGQRPGRQKDDHQGAELLFEFLAPPAAARSAAKCME